MSKGLDVAQVYECPEETRGKINSAILRFVWMGKRVVGPHDFGRSSSGLEVPVRAEEGVFIQRISPFMKDRSGSQAAEETPPSLDDAPEQPDFYRYTLSGVAVRLSALDQRSDCHRSLAVSVKTLNPFGHRFPPWSGRQRPLQLCVLL